MLIFLAFIGAAVAQPVVSSPSAIAVKPVSADRAIAEFASVCLQPQWKVAKIKDRVRKSDFQYSEDYRNDGANSYSWKSSYGYLTVNVRPEWSQCALSVGSFEPLTGPQLLAMLSPVIQAELCRQMQINREEFYVECTAHAGGQQRITLARASEQPTQSHWFVFDRTVPGLRKKLERLAPSLPNSKNSE